MARRKQINPMQRIPSGEVMQTLPDTPALSARPENGHAKGPTNMKSRVQRPVAAGATRSQGAAFEFAICVGGIYASFLTWAFLQERITKAPYASLPDAVQPKHSQEYFKFPVFLNTVQSFFAVLSGSMYLFITTKSLSVFPSRAVLGPLLLVSITSALASPFGYAALAHVDYLTFVLAKSCKLLPVMALHITLFRRRYPMSKYAIVLAVTAGVAIFTIYHPPKPGSKSKGASQSSMYGLALLGVNLLFDGLTNTVQDHVFRSRTRYGTISGPQMMIAQNVFATLLQLAYLLVTPLIPASQLPAILAGSTEELSSALAFLQRHPSVLYDVLGFCACGAVGQLFIYETLERFDSVLLVTVTVTRKMLTMLLSVFIFGKRLTTGQLMGVGLVIGGVCTEAWIGRQEKIEKEKLRKIN